MQIFLLKPFNLRESLKLTLSITPDTESLSTYLNNIHLVSRLSALCLEHNANLYLFGGGLRDYLLIGQMTNDLDFYLEAPDESACQTVIQVLSKEWSAGKLAPPPEEIKGIELVYTDCARLGILQNDLTVNAILFDLQNHTLIDPAGGLIDLEKRQLRMVSPLFYLANPVAFIRLFRQAAKTELQIAPETLAITQKFAGIIGTADDYRHSRLVAELYRLLNLPEMGANWSLFLQTGLLEHIFPELLPAAMVSIPGQAESFLAYNLNWMAALDTVFNTLTPSIREILSYLPPQSFHFLKQEKGKARDTEWPISLLSEMRLSCLFYRLGRAYIEVDPVMDPAYRSDQFADYTTQKMLSNLAKRASYFRHVCSTLLRGHDRIIQSTQWLEKGLESFPPGFNQAPKAQQIAWSVITLAHLQLNDSQLRRQEGQNGQEMALKNFLTQIK